MSSKTTAVREAAEAIDASCRKTVKLSELMQQPVEKFHSGPAVHLGGLLTERFAPCDLLGGTTGILTPYGWFMRRLWLAFDEQLNFVNSGKIDVSKNSLTLNFESGKQQGLLSGYSNFIYHEDYGKDFTAETLLKDFLPIAVKGTRQELYGQMEHNARLGRPYNEDPKRNAEYKCTSGHIQGLQSQLYWAEFSWPESREYKDHMIEEGIELVQDYESPVSACEIY